jgi:hypothetical protein
MEPSLGQQRAVYTDSSTLATKATDEVPKVAGFRLIPRRVLCALADQYAKGAAKYAPHDWEKGRAWSDYYDAAFRHLTAFWEGESLDEDGHPHLVAAAWCCLALYHFEETHPELDDRKEIR